MEAALKNAPDYIKDFKTKKIINIAETGVNKKDDKGRTSLLQACEAGLTDLAMDLIRKGADINIKDNNGRTPLSIALEKGNDNLVIALISNGANLSVLVESNILTPQFFKSHPQFVKFLSSNGAGGNSLSSQSLLIFTSQKDGTEALDAYVKAGGYINAACEHTGQTLLMGFAQSNNVDSIKAALEYGADIDMQDNDGRSALMHSILKGNKEAMEEFIKNCANAYLKDKEGNTALHLALLQKREDMAKSLIEKTDFNPAEKNNDGKTALMLAAENGNAELAELIIKKQAEKDAEEKSKKDLTPSSENSEPAVLKDSTEAKLSSKDSASASKNSKSVTTKGNLPQTSTLINSQDNLGNTALMYAGKSKKAEFFKLMLDHDADLFIKNNEGLSAIDLVYQSDNEELKEIVDKYLQESTSPKAQIFKTRYKLGLNPKAEKPKKNASANTFDISAAKKRKNKENN